MRNWCQYQHASVEFGTVTMILGPIGSGKSNLLNALCFALTGEIRSEGVKLDNVRQGAEPGEPADVVVEFSAGGAECEIRRSVRSSSVRLRVGDEVYTGSASVAQVMGSILRLDAELLRSFVFVDQWGMFDFLSHTDAVRERNFAKIVGLDKANRIHKMLGEFRLDEPVKTVDRVSVQTSLDNNLCRRAEVDRSLQDLLSKLLSEEQLKLPQTVVDSYPVFLSVSSTQKRIREQLHLANQAFETFKAHVDRESSALVLMELDVEKNRELVQAFPSIQQQWQRFQQNEREVTLASLALDADAKAEAACLATTPEKPPADAAATIEALSSKVRTIDVNVGMARLSLDAAVQRRQALQGRSACPTCGSPVAGDPNADVQLWTAKLAELQPARLEAAAALAALTKVVNDHTVFENRLIHARAKLAASQKIFDSLGQRLPKPTIALEVAAAAAAKARDFLRDYDNCKSQAATREQALAVRAETVSQLTKQLADVDKDLSTFLPLSEEVFQQAKSVLTSDLYNRRQVEVFRATITMLDETIAAEQARLAVATAEEIELSKFSALSGDLSRLRDVFQRDRAPAIFARDSLKAMLGTINSYLAEPEADFVVSEVEGLDSKHPLTFHVSFPSGVSVAAPRLSGGQKVLLALGFRLTLHQQFANDLGLMCLDEPTAGLNAVNIDAVGRLFSRIRADSEARGLQLVVVTHEQSLARFCDKVIDLSTWSM